MIPLAATALKVASSRGGLALIAFAAAWTLQGARLEMANHALRERAKDAIASAQLREREAKQRTEALAREAAAFADRVAEEQRINEEAQSRFRQVQRELNAARGVIETKSRQLAEELLKADDACKEVFVPDAIVARFRELHESVYGGVQRAPDLLQPSDVQDSAAGLLARDPSEP